MFLSGCFHLSSLFPFTDRGFNPYCFKPLPRLAALAETVG